MLEGSAVEYTAERYGQAADIWPGISLGIEAPPQGRAGRTYIRRSPHIASKLVDLRILAARPVRNIERPLRLKAEGITT
jgi:hypothetical protein